MRSGTRPHTTTPDGGGDGAYGWASMPEGDAIDHAAAALRSALVDEKMLRFEAPRLIGMTPHAGRTIERVERVERHGRHVEIEWDDETILHTNLRLRGSWYVHRVGESWQRPHHELRVLIEVDGWVAVCFNAPMVETYRRPDPLRHPGLRGARARTSPGPTPTSSAASTCAGHYDDGGRPARRGAARPAGVVRARQRVPLRAPVGRAAQPVRARRRPLRARGDRA